MDFLSWRWLNPITLEAINPQQCNFPSRQDLPGFPPHALCFSLFPLLNTQTQSLSSSVSPHSLYLFLPMSSIISLLTFFLLVYISFTFFHTLVTNSFFSCPSLFYFFIFSLLYMLLYPFLVPSKALSLSYYTTLPVTFICLLFFPLQVFPSSFIIAMSPQTNITSSQPSCFLLCPTTLFFFYYTILPHRTSTSPSHVPHSFIFKISYTQYVCLIPTKLLRCHCKSAVS